MNLLGKNYNFFGGHKFLKLLNNLVWIFNLLLSKNKIDSHKGLERAYLIDWK